MSLAVSCTAKLHLALLVCAFHLWQSTEAMSLHVWKGQIVVFREKWMTLNETQLLCDQLGGHLPSVHSEEDVLEMTSIVGNASFVWLGAKPADKSLQDTDELAFEWADGTPFDLEEWSSKYLRCKSSCCGVSLTRDDSSGKRLYTAPCDDTRSMFCVLSSLAPSVDLSEEGSEFLLPNVSIKVLNETFNQWQSINNNLHSRLESLQSQLRNQTEQTESKSKSSEKCNEELELNRMDTKWLDFRVDICLGLLSFIALCILFTSVKRMFRCFKPKKTHFQQLEPLDP